MTRRPRKAQGVSLATIIDSARMAKRGLRAARERAKRQEPPAGVVRSWVENVQRDGCCVVPDFYDYGTCMQLRVEVEEAILRYPNAVHIMSGGADRRVFGAELAGPGIRAFAEDSRLLAAARATLSGNAANAFTLAGSISYSDGNLGSGEGWHRDSFFNQFKAIVYLSDVTERNGPFEYITESHRLRDKLSDYRAYRIPLTDSRISDSLVEGLIEAEPSRHKVFTASMGTLLLVDTTGIHRGMPLKAGERFALTNYYFPATRLGSELMDYFQPVLGHHVPVG